ncbi:aldehyde dehydrogenase family protein [Escherichia coli]
MYPEFVKRFAERANRLRVGDPTIGIPRLARLSASSTGKKFRLYPSGIEEGATLLAGGPDKPSDLPAHLKGGNFLRPTVLQTLITVCASPRKRFWAGRLPAAV